MNKNGSLLTPEEAAEFLGLSTATLSSWRTRPPRGGAPVYSKIGRLVKYNQADLDEFIRQSRRRHTSQQVAC